ncbi:MAG: hypothetical protein PHD53_00900 [Methylococcales bacterium]|nr:hypothetical protein [Methylococcales bacterium]
MIEQLIPQHTPAPWRVRNEFGRLLVIATVSELEIAEVKWLSDCEDEGDTEEANAKLFAAAPELLAALVDIVKASDGVSVEGIDLSNACAAIAKATQ